MTIIPLLTDAQQLTLHALVDRIIPPDDFPGGWEAGVGEYLARQLSGDLQAFLPLYQMGLDALDAEALSSTGAPFAALEAAAQDALLAQVEAGTVATAWPADPRLFFRAANEHTIEGFYSDPGNGGNRGGVAWQMIGFEVTN